VQCSHDPRTDGGIGALLGEGIRQQGKERAGVQDVADHLGIARLELGLKHRRGLRVEEV
jgi:hypothetical protein